MSRRNITYITYCHPSSSLRALVRARLLFKSRESKVAKEKKATFFCRLCLLKKKDVGAATFVVWDRVRWNRRADQRRSSSGRRVPCVLLPRRWRPTMFLVPKKRTPKSVTGVSPWLLRAVRSAPASMSFWATWISSQTWGQNQRRRGGDERVKASHRRRRGP